ncbi:hypothetical protein LP415_00340 [Polaromonas sp. P1(28)-8]|nr:hypothetical protein LP415_00340 [Polaromonas sp. P1(28)-8]
MPGRSRDQLRRVQIVFQMADTALNPAHTIEMLLARPLQLYFGLKGEPLKSALPSCWTWCSCPRSAQRLPGGLSGGQKQRVNFARAGRRAGSDPVR